MKVLLGSRVSCLGAAVSLVLLLVGLSVPAQTCEYTAMDSLGRMSPNFSIFPPGSYYASTSLSPGFYYERSVVSGMGCSIQMTCDTDPGTYLSAVYQLQIAYRWTGGSSPDIVHALAVSAGSHLDRPSTTAYQTAPNVWSTACFLTNDPGVLHPTVSFTYQSGTVDNAHRVCADLFRFTRIPSGPPLLKVTGCDTNVVISWSTAADGYQLLECSDLQQPRWSVVTNAPSIVNNQYQVTITPLPGASRYYRLAH